MKIKLKVMFEKLSIKINRIVIYKLNKLLKKQQKSGDERIIELANLLIKEVQDNGYKLETCGMQVAIDINKYSTDRMTVSCISNGWEVGYKLLTSNR
jgi:hypothetical protein